MILSSQIRDSLADLGIKMNSNRSIKQESPRTRSFELFGGESWVNAWYGFLVGNCDGILRLLASEKALRARLSLWPMLVINCWMISTITALGDYRLCLSWCIRLTCVDHFIRISMGAKSDQSGDNVWLCSDCLRRLSLEWKTLRIWYFENVRQLFSALFSPGGVVGREGSRKRIGWENLNG